MTKSYQHLTYKDRVIIAHECRQGTNCTEIAKMINKHRTTVVRELRRNSREQGHYVAGLAHQRTQHRRSEASSQPRPKNAPLK